MKKRLIALSLAFLLILIPAIAQAQSLYFGVEREEVNVYWNEDGTAAIDYVYVFNNSSYGAPIDYVDLGLPNNKYDEGSIFADVDGQPLSDISSSGFEGDGCCGVAIGLGSQAIRPGQTATFHAFVGTVRGMLRPDKDDKAYTSAVFSPNWFGSQFVNGSTDLSVTYHFPAGVQPEEPRWHNPPSGWASEPETGFDADGRITYTWRNSNSDAYSQYFFGASFPRQYVPANAVASLSIFEMLGVSQGDFFGFMLCGGSILFFGFIIFFSFYSSLRRRNQYFPPKIAIEGHGIKRGLTAVEAAILLEQPLDKVLTMILFAVIKKEAATVVTRDPLKLEVVDPLPADMYEYEVDFLKAFKDTTTTQRRRALQETTINLVKSVSAKMKGFSRKETLAYYREITQKAWAQVEAADTPEVKSQKFDEVMEWTMLDRDYDDRTRRTFTGGPVFVPMWWHRYDPSFGGGAATTSHGGPAMSGGGGISLPNLPGSDFAASMVNGVQNFSSKVIGNVSDFTSSVTNKTNPAPVSTSSRGGGGGHSSGGGCACACACAGCACACAGGGR